MRKQLLNKFTGRYGWVIVWLFAVSTVMAKHHPQADTCQHPEPPIITGSAKAICRNELVTLNATGCTGTVIWSNGDTGNSITVQPQQTTKYTAICRAKPGCISCFADVWKITVNTPASPTVTASAKLICLGESATLTAKNCQGTVHWLSQDGTELGTGPTLIDKVQATTSYRAICEQANCRSNPSLALAVEVGMPITPTISANTREVCAGQSVRITASGCLGTVRWSDGKEGLARSVNPIQTTNYRAICQIGTCQNDSSQAISVVVRTADQTLALQTKLTNTCPFQTADLSKAIIASNSSNLHYEFRTEASILSPAIQSPGAVLAGTYYIFGRTADGCYTESVAVTVTNQPCQNAIPACLSNPAFVAIKLDSINWTKGSIQLTAQLKGSATQPNWQSDGGGLFTDVGRKTRYLFSETDRQRGYATFTLSVSDPDGDGPCQGASTQQTLTAPSQEIVGLSKKVSEPLWVTDGKNRLVELTYLLTVANLGKNELKNIRVADDLETAFSSSGAQVRSATTRADSGLVINAAYSGRGTDTLLVTSGRLEAGRQAHVWLTVRLDVSQANTLTFANIALVQATDITSGLCRDQSYQWF